MPLQNLPLEIATTTIITTTTVASRHLTIKMILPLRPRPLHHRRSPPLTIRKNRVVASTVLPQATLWAKVIVMVMAVIAVATTAVVIIAVAVITVLATVR